MYYTNDHQSQAEDSGTLAAVIVPDADQLQRTRLQMWFQRKLIQDGATAISATLIGDVRPDAVAAHNRLVVPDVTAWLPSDHKHLVMGSRVEARTSGTTAHPTDLGGEDIFLCARTETMSRLEADDAEAEAELDALITWATHNGAIIKAVTLTSERDAIGEWYAERGLPDIELVGAPDHADQSVFLGVNLEEVEIPMEYADVLPEALARELVIVPVEVCDDTWLLAAQAPELIADEAPYRGDGFLGANLLLSPGLVQATEGAKVHVAVADGDQIIKALDRLYSADKTD